MRLRCSWRAGRSSSIQAAAAGSTEAPAVSRCRAAGVGRSSRSTTAGSASSHGRCCAGTPSARLVVPIASTSAARSVSASSVCSARSCGRTGAGRPTADHGTGQARGAGAAGPRVGVGAASADPAALERHQGRGPAAGEGPARGPLVDAGGVGGVHDVAAVVLVGHPERDPQVGVGADLRGHHAAGPLGRQHQVDAQRPAALGDADQALHEVGQLGGEPGELVDDQDQPRDRRKLGPGALQSPVVLEVLGPGPGEQVLAPLELGAEETRARLTRCASRSVTMPTVCGSRAQSLNAEPPL